MACYDASEDWTPIYDKSKLNGYFMAIGTSGNQVQRPSFLFISLPSFCTVQEHGRGGGAHG